MIDIIISIIDIPSHHYHHLFISICYCVNIIHSSIHPLSIIYWLCHRVINLTIIYYVTPITHPPTHQGIFATIISASSTFVCAFQWCFVSLTVISSVPHTLTLIHSFIRMFHHHFCVHANSPSISICPYAPPHSHSRTSTPFALILPLSHISTYHHHSVI